MCVGPYQANTCADLNIMLTNRAAKTTVWRCHGTHC